MIDLEKPEAEAARVLTGKTLSETGGRGDFKVVENDNSTDGRLVHGQKQGVFALGWIGRAVDENEFRLLQTEEGFTLSSNIERLNGSKSIPAAGQWHDLGEIGIAFRD